jgi:hypothetical protein
MEGKTVKCKGCGKSFTVEPADAVVSAVATKPSNGKAKAIATTKKAVKPVKKAGDDDDEDDEEEEYEVPAKKGGMGKWLLIGGGLVAVLMLFVCGGVGVGGYFIYRSYNSSDDTASTSDKDKDKDKKKDQDSKDKDSKDKDKKDKNDDKPASKKITLANFQQIKVGQTVEQVEAILGPPWLKVPFDNRTTLSTWASAPDTIDITFTDGKVEKWTAVIGQVVYSGPSPGTKPPPDSGTKVTKANWDQIRGGMTREQVQAILGQASIPFAPADGDDVAVVGNKGTTDVWSNKLDAITVSYNEQGRAARWTVRVNGQSEVKKDDAYAVKATKTSPITKDTFDKIMGGETQDQIKALLSGAKLNANTMATDQVTATYDKSRIDTWSDDMGNNMTIVYCNGFVARWSANIGGVAIAAKTNQQFVLLKGANPPGKLTKAAYNQIIENQTLATAVAAGGWGNPAPNGNNGKDPKKDPNGFRTKWVWIDGNARVDVEVNLAGVITWKRESGLK